MSHCRSAVFSAVVLALLLSGCALGPRSASSVRLEDILSPVKDSLVATDKKPLTFPATVAILMVPQGNRVMVPDTTMRIAAEALKKELAKNTRYVSGRGISPGPWRVCYGLVKSVAVFQARLGGSSASNIFSSRARS